MSEFGSVAASSPRSLSIEVGVPVIVRDGTRLLADIYRPAGPGRWPVILLRTPYDRRLGAAMAQQVHAVRLAEAGYAVVVQDVRGRFGSEGEFYPFFAEASDGVDTIGWAAVQPWSSGDVGMVGTSYAGYNQVLTAKERPPQLRAWFPGFTPVDARREWVYEGDAFCLGFNLSWTLGAIALKDHRTSDRSALIRALDDWGETVRRDIRDHPALAATAAGRHYFDWIERRDDQSYWAAISGVGVADSTAPAAQIGGWFDLFAAGTFTLHEALARGKAGSFHRLIIGPWDHSALPLGTGAGETDFGVAAAFDLANAQRAWFDWLLRGESQPAWCAAQVFLTGWNHWEQLDAWPPPSRVVSWYLQSNSRLDTTPSAASEVRFIADADQPAPTVGGRLCCAPYKLRPGQFDQRSRAARPDVIMFASPPMSRDLLVAGPVRAEIWATSSATEGDLFATLVDVAADDRAVNLAEGVARRRFEAGDATRFDIDLGHAGHAFRAGHQIRVDLAAHSFPRFDRCPAHGVTKRSILLGPSSPSRIFLPIVD